MGSSLTLIIGGARSGKSTYAEKLVAAHPAPWTYIATAEAYDQEMRLRIAEHKVRRREGWETFEAPMELAEALEKSRELIEAISFEGKYFRKDIGFEFKDKI